MISTRVMKVVGDVVPLDKEEDDRVICLGRTHIYPACPLAIYTAMQGMRTRFDFDDVT